MKRLVVAVVVVVSAAAFDFFRWYCVWRLVGSLNTALLFCAAMTLSLVGRWLKGKAS